MYWTKVYSHSAVELYIMSSLSDIVSLYTGSFFFTLMEIRKHDHKIYCTDCKSPLLEICDKY
jgi:hypothetical protein